MQENKARSEGHGGGEVLDANVGERRGGEFAGMQDFRSQCGSGYGPFEWVGLVGVLGGRGGLWAAVRCGAVRVDLLQPCFLRHVNVSTS